MLGLGVAGETIKGCFGVSSPLLKGVIAASLQLPLDVVTFPALLLAQQYHQCWEAENTLSELKTKLNGRKVAIRSKHPRLLIQEVYGWLIAYWVIRILMFQAAQQKQLSPLRLSFTGSLRAIRRAMPEFQTAQAQENHFFGVG